MIPDVRPSRAEADLIVSTLRGTPALTDVLMSARVVDYPAVAARVEGVGRRHHRGCPMRFLIAMWFVALMQTANLSFSVTYYAMRDESTSAAGLLATVIALAGLLYVVVIAVNATRREVSS